MREIKFRAWDAREERMVSHFALSMFGEKWNSKRSEYPLQVLKDSVDLRDEVILMQYTGLKDKNGVEIYEGDVVKFATTPPGAGGKQKTCFGEVWYKAEECSYSVKSPQFTFHDGQPWIIGLCPRPDFYEVVGNIYENPELLEEVE